ncbi:carboxypeptidase-like regulatory domain-containing protein, partial [Patescibacteria group bacterium]|nr:carboxypeptidase-like regulatory domain-containing protein [Patescibacteria group bacterium]
FLNITTGSALPDGDEGVAYNQALSTTKDQGVVSYVLMSGALPAGVNISGTSLVGTPTLAGNYSFGLRAIDTISGSSFYSDTKDFTLSVAGTPVVVPTLTTDIATSVTATTATLHGEITDTGGEDASDIGFNYGTDMTYGTDIVESSGPYALGTFTADITGLTCNTIYNFRSFGENGAGTGVSANNTFTTSACPSSHTHVSGGSINPHPITPTPPVENPTTPPVSETPVVHQTTPPRPTTPTVPNTETDKSNDNLNTENDIPVVDERETTTKGTENTSAIHFTPSKNEDNSGQGIRGFVKSAFHSAKLFLDKPAVRTFDKLAVLIPAFLSVLALLTALFSGVPASNYLLYSMVLLAQILGFKKVSKPWGTVYDSNTKKPIPFARVEILNSESRKLESVITDQTGRYGFLIGEEQISREQSLQIRAYQKNYNFPSIAEVSPVEKMMYPNIYKGGPINDVKNLTNYDLPLDPVANRTTKNFYFGITSIGLNNTITKVANVLFAFGVLLGLATFVLSPTLPAGILILVILVTYILRTSGLKLKSFGLTKDKESHTFLPFGFIALHDQTGRRVSFTVSDNKGRYFLLTQSGQYLLKAYTPAHIIPTRTTEIPVFTQKGWISKEVSI